MITCQRCSTENLDGSQYCDECGALLSVVAPSVAAHLSSAIPPHAPVESPLVTPIATPPVMPTVPSPDEDSRAVISEQYQAAATDGDASIETDPSRQGFEHSSSLAPTAGLQMPPSMIAPASAPASVTPAESAPEAFSPEMTFVAPVRKVSPPVAEQAPPVNSFDYQSAENNGTPLSEQAERATESDAFKPQELPPPIASPQIIAPERVIQESVAPEKIAPAASIDPWIIDSSGEQRDAGVYAEAKSAFGGAPENSFSHENGSSARGTSDVSYAGEKMDDERPPANNYARQDEGALKDERAFNDEPQTSVSGAVSGRVSTGGLNEGKRASASSFAPPIPPAAPPQMPPASATIANFNRTSLLGGANAFGASAGNSKATSQAHAKLVIQRGRATGKEFSLSEEVTQIGRWDADGGIFPDVDLDADDVEAKVSRRHARIMRRGEQYFVEDLGSTNGTFVNRGRRLLPGDLQPLRDGDEVIVGKTFMKFIVLR